MVGVWYAEGFSLTCQNQLHNMTLVFGPHYLFRPMKALFISTFSTKLDKVEIFSKMRPQNQSIMLCVATLFRPINELIK